MTAGRVIRPAAAAPPTPPGPPLAAVEALHAAAFAADVAMAEWADWYRQAAERRLGLPVGSEFADQDRAFAAALARYGRVHEVLVAAQRALVAERGEAAFARIGAPTREDDKL